MTETKSTRSFSSAVSCNGSEDETVGAEAGIPNKDNNAGKLPVNVANNTTPISRMAVPLKPSNRKIAGSKRIIPPEPLRTAETP